MDDKKNRKKGAAAPKAKPQQRPRRQPGASAQQKPQKAPHAQPRKHAPVQEQPIRVTPEVVYLAPKPFSRNRLILRLATVVAVVLALMLGLSVFFKVETIRVSGCSQYTAWQVQQISGIQEGDQLLTLNRAKAAGKITNALPYVKTARIGISLPGTVNIEIVEIQVTYAVEAVDGTWWAMDSTGKLVTQITENREAYTLISGVTVEQPAVGQQAKAWQDTTAQTDEEGNVIPVTVTAQQKLQIVVDLTDYLEDNGIIGEAKSINVGDLNNIELWYGDKYQVLLGDNGDLGTKISYLKAIVDDYAEKRPYESGTLDLSDPDWIEYQSFAEQE